MENLQKRWMTYKGSKICYQQSKINQDKPFLIFLHGFLSCQYSFRKMIPLLNQHFNIITLDLPPFGDSDRVRSFNYSYKNMADMIIYFMNYLSIEKAHLVGHSMGGQIALRCAYQYQSRVNSLILLAPSCYLVKADRISYLLSLLPFFPQLLRKLLKRKGVLEMLRQSLYNESILTDEMLYHYKKPFLDKAMYICLTKMIRDREGDLSASVLEDIKAKSFLFWGKCDEIIPVTTGYNMLRDLPNANLVTFNYAGHLLPEELPNQISDYIIHHLA